MKKGVSAILSSGTVNRYGYRVLVSGIRLQSFIENPVMFYVHRRSNQTAETENLSLPIGKWENIRVENNQLLADPIFDMEDDFAAKIARKWEKGFLNATSIQHTFDEISEDAIYLLDGQIRPTVIACEVLEASIVDIGGDRDAIKLRHSKNGEDPLSKLPLLSLQLKSVVDMDLKQIARSLGLNENATEAEVIAKIAAMRAAQVEGVLALGRQKGVVNDGNIAAMRVLADTNPDFAQLSWSSLPDAVAQTTPSVPEVKTVGTLAAALRAEGKSGAVADERACWTIQDWRKKDANGFLALEKTDPDKFAALVAEMVQVGSVVLD